MVVAGRDVGGQRPERVERRFGALLQLQLHVLLDELHRHVAGAFDHHLAIMLPRLLRQFAERGEFGQLRFIVRVRARAGAEPVAERERDVVGLHDFANLVEVGVEEIFLVMREAPLREDRAAPADDAAGAARGHRHVAQQHARVDREIIDALLGLLDERVAVEIPGQVLGAAADFFQRLVNGHRADRHR